MELSQAEALGTVDEHDGRVGNVDADFDDARRHQEVNVPLLKGLHDGFLFFSGHAAMNEAAGAFFKELMAQLFVKVGRSLEVDGLRGLYQRTDDIALLAGFHKLVHESIDPPAQASPTA